MSCSVAVASSPVFSASRIPITCKTSPESLSLGIAQHHLSSTAVVDGSPSTASSLPFLRFQRVASSLRLKNEMSTSETDGVNASVVSPSSSSASSSCFSSGLASNSCGSASVFKRKRPARIDIPMMRLQTLHPLPDSCGPAEVEAESARYSVYCKRGRKRLEMEDRHSAMLNIGGDPQSAFFGIFDGHGGAKAAEFVSERIGDRILEGVTLRRSEKEEEGRILLEIAVRKGYLKIDAEFLNQELGGGTCCVTALVRKGDLVISNSGDCRAVLSVSGAAEVLTSDHRLSRKDEKERIESLGGYVDCCRGVWRLQSSLAVSRGIGDSHLKQWVIPDPETRILRIEPNHEFLILASDGLWDKVSNQEAVDVARPLCVTPKPNVLSACRRLADLSIARGSVDDISVMIVQLGQFL
ncbi:hypothetical protein HPP92_012034 [Vanilla planifolia]|uniref:protein-serine/threonine phosphatase n=1 Tax=Vanilla planifolia TaxID=51239 RepID=A0A835QWU1_VANPL|nr:hypothetical protein HPP92_012034 [Vanilla planifolia]